MKKLYFLIILISIANAQWTQIGQNIDDKAASDYSDSSVSIRSDGTFAAFRNSENNN